MPWIRYAEGAGTVLLAVWYIVLKTRQAGKNMDAILRANGWVRASDGHYDRKEPMSND